METGRIDFGEIETKRGPNIITGSVDNQFGPQVVLSGFVIENEDFVEFWFQ